VKWMKWVPNNGRMRHWPHGQARCGNTVSKSSGAVGMLGCLVERDFLRPHDFKLIVFFRILTCHDL
jgi:hypothetical protein